MPSDRFPSASAASSACTTCGVTLIYVPEVGAMHVGHQAEDMYVKGSWSGKVYFDEVGLRFAVKARGNTYFMQARGRPRAPRRDTVPLSGIVPGTMTREGTRRVWAAAGALLIHRDDLSTSEAACAASPRERVWTISSLLHRPNGLSLLDLAAVATALGLEDADSKDPEVAERQVRQAVKDGTLFIIRRQKRAVGVSANSVVFRRPLPGTKPSRSATV